MTKAEKDTLRQAARHFMDTSDELGWDKGMKIICKMAGMMRAVDNLGEAKSVSIHELPESTARFGKPPDILDAAAEREGGAT